MLLRQCPDISYHSKKKHKPLHQHASCNTHWLPISADDAMLPANVPTKLSQPLTSPRLKLPKQRQGRSQKATGKWCPSCFEVFKHIEFGLFLHVPGVCKLLLQGFTQAVKSTAIKPTRGYRTVSSIHCYTVARRGHCVLPLLRTHRRCQLAQSVLQC